MSEKNKKNSWTPEQRKAIGYEEGYENCQLLVAAGAGSGKTSVLTERILKKIKEGKDISDFLVVTFTVASAEDMKEKLRRKLLKEYATCPDNKYLSKQIAKLPYANISTITSFCLNLVKKNFTTLGISPNVRMADENEADAIFEKAMDLLLDEEFEARSQELHDLISLSACRSKETTLASYLRAIYIKLRAHPNYIKVLNEATKTVVNSVAFADTLENYLQSPAGSMVKEALDVLLSSVNNEIPQMIAIAENYGGTLESNAYFHKANIDKAIQCAQTGNFEACVDACHEAANLKYQKGTPFKEVSPEDKSNYKELKDEMEERCDELALFVKELKSTLLSDAGICAKISKGIERLITRLDEIYTELKKEKGVIDFTDAEQLTHRLLLGEDNQPTQLCKELAASIEEVLVDEYQDTNPLQDSIFAALATKNNRFMVGDDKQSIYRFRNAFPDIFNGYKKEFITDDKKCIFLKENFRCSQEIINFANTVFRFLWGGTYKKEELIFAKESPAPPIDPEKLVRVKVFETSLSNLGSSVYEAEYIGNEIKKLVGTCLKGNTTTLTYSDIAIIVPVLKNVGEVFLKKLQEMGIPAFTKKVGALTEMPEVKLVLSILKAINNPQEDISLASAMNSFFFGFTADELAEIRKTKNTSLFSSVLKYAGGNANRRFTGRYALLKKNTGTRDVKSDAQNKILERKSKLRKKCRTFIRTLDVLRNKSRVMECRKLIWELYENYGLLSAIENTQDGETKKGNLLLLYTQAIEFGKKEYKTLSAFLKQVENLSVPSYSPESPNAVSIITIHGSKGLEFPVCFIANAGKRPIADTGERMPVVHTKYGIFTPLKDETFHTRYSNFYLSAKIVERPEEIAEEKRELYVALTRARDLMYIVGSASAKTNLYNASPLEMKSYLKWILTANPDCIFEKTVIEEKTDECEDETCSEEIILTSSNEAAEQFDGVEDEFDDGFVYPYAVSAKLPRKLSVSQLKKAANEEYEKSVKRSDFISVPSFAIESKKISGAEVGTANHTFMQFASFENCVNYGVEAEGERLLLTEMLTKEQFEMLNFKNLKAFFQSNLFSRIRQSKKVYREKRFTISDNSERLLGIGNETVLVQGVIDLFFLNENGTYTVVDYKTDRIKNGDEELLIDRYKAQIKYYAKAVEEMTGKKTTEGILYSFALSKEIIVPLGETEEK